MRSRVPEREKDAPASQLAAAIALMGEIWQMPQILSMCWCDWMMDIYVGLLPDKKAWSHPD